MTISNRRTAAAVASLAAAALIATACSTTDDAAATSTDAHSGHGQSTSASASPDASAHNDADVMFNQMMIPHHQQAVTMADLVPSRTENTQLRSLATQIKNAQQPEIDQMTARLKAWGVSTESDHSNMNHDGMGDMSSSMGGMMTDAQMTAMQQARGEAFDKLWLTGMIAHHQGAITMADDELANGINPQSRSLATQIKTSQQAEINQMKTMLGQ